MACDIHRRWGEGDGLNFCAFVRHNEQIEDVAYWRYAGRAADNVGVELRQRRWSCPRLVDMNGSMVWRVQVVTCDENGDYTIRFKKILKAQ